MEKSKVERARGRSMNITTRLLKARVAVAIILMATVSHCKTEPSTICKSCHPINNPPPATTPMEVVTVGTTTPPAIMTTPLPPPPLPMVPATGTTTATENPSNCIRAECIYPKGCKYGIVPDGNNCCPICGLGPGEKCGGPNNSWGYCGAGIVCFFSGEEAIDKNEGFCLKKDEDAQPTQVPATDENTTLETASAVITTTASIPTPSLPLPLPSAAAFSNKCESKCDRSKCIYPAACKHGIVPGPCNCCPRCGLGPKKRCGGADNEIGFCGKGMVCLFNGQQEIDKKEGTCVFDHSHLV